MSMEQAILELAAAIRALAESNRPEVLVAERNSVEPWVVHPEVKANPPASPAAKPTAKEAINQALADAKEAKEKKESAQTDTQSAQLQDAGAGSDAAPEVTWEQIRELLVKVGKVKEELLGLMAKYDIPKGGTAAPEKFADLYAEAKAILAARG